MTKSSHHSNLAVFLFLVSSGLELAAAQSGPPDPNYDPYAYGGRLSPAMSVVVVVVIALLFFMGFFTIYIRHCTRAAGGGSVNPTGAVRRVRNAAVARGLEASIIETFPTLLYSEVKTQKIGKEALECAICLNDFEEDETLRLLPKCDHVFHPHCIDAWLQAHVTCPVCRLNLADQKPLEPIQTDIESQQSVIPEPEVELDEGVARVNLPRSHTTGHSVVLPGENIDRFTLRLPEDLRKKIMANWKMNRSNSVLVIPRGGSSRRSGKQVDRSRARSDRWLFRKTPSFLCRNRDDGSIRLGGSIRAPTGDDSVRAADRWAFLRNPSFMWRTTTPLPSPKVEQTSSVQHAASTTDSVKLPV